MGEGSIVGVGGVLGLAEWSVSEEWAGEEWNEGGGEDDQLR